MTATSWWRLTTESGGRSAATLRQLLAWQEKAGGQVYDSSTGFKMSTGAVRFELGEPPAGLKLDIDAIARA